MPSAFAFAFAPASALALAAAALYLLTTALQSRRLRSDAGHAGRGFVALSLAALLAHGCSTLLAVQSPAGVNLGFFKMASLILWLVNGTLLLSLSRRPLANLAVILHPLSAAAVVTAALAPGNTRPFAEVSGGMLLHIGSSALAHAVLTIAAAQAAAVAVMDRQLRHHHTRGLVRILPPLQLMEAMLFECLWVGLVLLTVAIGSGLVFLEDILAQHLAHKTVLTGCAWALFATLLWGHHRLGWRSQTAVRFTLAGFAVLMLGYFGSKLVLELILGRV